MVIEYWCKWEDLYSYWTCRVFFFFFTFFYFWEDSLVQQNYSLENLRHMKSSLVTLAEVCMLLCPYLQVLMCQPVPCLQSECVAVGTLIELLIMARAIFPWGLQYLLEKQTGSGKEDCKSTSPLPRNNFSALLWISVPVTALFAALFILMSCLYTK